MQCYFLLYCFHIILFCQVWPIDTTAYKGRVKLKKIFDVFFGRHQITIAVADSQNRLKVHHKYFTVKFSFVLVLCYRVLLLL